MKLLQHSWSDMLVLDHIHQRMHNNLPDETTLHNGQKFDLLSLGLLGVPSLADHFNDITAKLQELKFDVSDYICIKFLLLLNPGLHYEYILLSVTFYVWFMWRCFLDVRGISNRKHVQDGYEQVQRALHDYTVTCYPQIQVRMLTFFEARYWGNIFMYSWMICYVILSMRRFFVDLKFCSNM